MGGWARSWCWRHRAEGGVGGAWNPGTDTRNKVKNKKGGLGSVREREIEFQKEKKKPKILD